MGHQQHPFNLIFQHLTKEGNVDLLQLKYMCKIIIKKSLFENTRGERGCSFPSFCPPPPRASTRTLVQTKGCSVFHTPSLTRGGGVCAGCSMDHHTFYRASYPNLAVVARVERDGKEPHWGLLYMHLSAAQFKTFCTSEAAEGDIL